MPHLSLHVEKIAHSLQLKLSASQLHLPENPACLPAQAWFLKVDVIPTLQVALASACMTRGKVKM